MISKIEAAIDRHEKIFILAAVLLSFGILSCTLWTAYPLHTTTDELGAIVGAATWAGYDWSDVIGRSGYYGFGYYSLFAPLFYLKLSPIVIYRIILLITRLVRASIICVTVYYIGRNYLKFESKILLLCIAVICSIPLHVNDASNIINDVMLDTVMWMIILSVCKLIEYSSDKRFFLWFCIYLLLGTFILFLHTRAIVVPIASAIVILIVFAIKRNFRGLFICVFGPLYVGAKFFINGYQAFIFESKEGVANTSVTVSTKIDILDADTWEIWLDMLIGHLSVQNALTGGLFILALIGCIHKVIRVFAKKEKISDYELTVWLISLMCVGAVFGAFLISSWQTNMYAAWNTSRKGTDYCYKAMCYVRYWNVFASPMVLVGTHWAFKDNTTKKYSITLAISAGLVVLFLTYVYPVVENNGDAAGFLMPFYTDASEKIKKVFYYKALLISFGIAIFSYILTMNKGYKNMALIPIMLMVLIGYCEGNINYNKPIRDKVSSMALASYNEVSALESENIKLGNIYAVDEGEKDRNWYIFSVLQFYLYEYTIKEDLPENLQDNDIIIATARNKNIEENYNGLKCYVLDNNEVWYTKLDLDDQEAISLDTAE